MSIDAIRGFAYQAVYRYIATLIDEAPPGLALKLPSLRHLSRRLNVSISTVLAAYSLLEAEGQVYAVAKSGYYVFKATDPSSPERTSDVLHTLQRNAHRQDLTVLCRSLASASTSLEPLLQRRERELLRQCPTLVGSLSDPCGDLTLRRALAARYTTSPRQFWGADDVYLGMDTRAVLQLLVAAMDLKGCAVLVSSPCSWMILRTLQQSGVEVVELPLCPLGRSSPDRLLQLLRGPRVRLAIFDSAASTPQGTLMPETDRQAVVHILEHHGIWLLENDLDGDLCYLPTRRMREWANPERLLVLASLGEVIGAEAPFGYLLSRHFSPQLRRLFLQRSFHLPPIRQQAIARLYRSGRIDQHLAQRRLYTQERLHGFHRAVEQALQGHLQCELPLGGAALWARCRYPVNMPGVFKRLLMQRILIAPGELFSLQGLHRQHVRLGLPLQDVDLAPAWSALGEALEHERLH